MDRFYADLSNSSIWILSAGYSHHKTNEDKRVFRVCKSVSFDHYSGQISLRHILLQEEMLEIRNFFNILAENEKERKFLLKTVADKECSFAFPA